MQTFGTAIWTALRAHWQAAIIAALVLFSMETCRERDAARTAARDFHGKSAALTAQLDTVARSLIKAQAVRDSLQRREAPVLAALDSARKAVRDGVVYVHLPPTQPGVPDDTSTRTAVVPMDSVDKLLRADSALKVQHVADLAADTTFIKGQAQTIALQIKQHTLDLSEISALHKDIRAGEARAVVTGAALGAFLTLLLRH